METAHLIVVCSMYKIKHRVSAQLKQKRNLLTLFCAYKVAGLPSQVKRSGSRMCSPTTVTFMLTPSPCCSSSCATHGLHTKPAFLERSVHGYAERKLHTPTQSKSYLTTLTLSIKEKSHSPLNTYPEHHSTDRSSLFHISLFD